jgi:hypothetical protein
MIDLTKTLERNPLVEDRMKYPERQFVPTDETPFYAKEEVEHPNKRFADRVDLFHQQVKDVRWERPRVGDCNNTLLIEKHMDGQVWNRVERCPGKVHAVETKINGAVRIDGKCLTCGWEIHRAGLLKED